MGANSSVRRENNKQIFYMRTVICLIVKVKKRKK